MESVWIITSIALAVAYLVGTYRINRMKWERNKARDEVLRVLLEKRVELQELGVKLQLHTNLCDRAADYVAELEKENRSYENIIQTQNKAIERWLLSKETSPD